MVTMAVKLNDTSKLVWDILMERIGNPYGVAALMGNIFAESSMNPQCTTPRKQFYVEQVDNGSISKDLFMEDKTAFGLAQWYSPNRKGMLYEAAIKERKSIGDAGMQARHIVDEIRTYYQSVWNIVVNARAIKPASDLILTRYEKPANTSDAVKEKREKFSQVYYDTYIDSEPSETQKEDTVMKESEPQIKVEVKHGKYVQTTADKVRIRTGNSKDFPMIRRIEKSGAEFPWVATAENGWYAIDQGETEKWSFAGLCWISGEFSKIVEK